MVVATGFSGIECNLALAKAETTSCSSFWRKLLWPDTREKPKQWDINPTCFTVLSQACEEQGGKQDLVVIPPQPFSKHFKKPDR